MGKITVKHFLNTNLKPYLINGDKYFSIYALVTANRQNTKVKSKVFNEYYTESDFSDIIKSKEDKETLKYEKSAIINIADMIIMQLDKFDTTFFSAIFNFYQNIYIGDIDIERCFVKIDNKEIEVNLYEKEKNSLGICIDLFLFSKFSIKENNAKGMSLLTWFSNTGQSELKTFLNGAISAVKINETISIINQLVFLSSMEKLYWFISGSKKFEVLQERYCYLFDGIDLYTSELYKKLAP